MTTVTDSQQYSNWINQKTQPTSMWRLEGGGIATYLPKGCHWTIFLSGDSLWLQNPFKPAVDRETTLSAWPFRPVALVLLSHSSSWPWVFYLGQGHEMKWVLCVPCMGTMWTQRAFGGGGTFSDHSPKWTRACSTLQGRKLGNNGDSSTLILQICNANYANRWEVWNLFIVCVIQWKYYVAHHDIIQ